MTDTKHTACFSTQRSRRGFTLIELSIVLVIIGLIAGSILVGREMIAAAEIRALIRQMESYNAAVNAFKQKYGCIPGDCKDAVDYGLGISGGDGDNGDGNGRVDVVVNDASSIGIETQHFWYHLHRANMISQNALSVGTTPGINSPPLAKPGVGKGANPRGGMWIANEYISTFQGNPGYEDFNTRPPIKHAWLTITGTLLQASQVVVGPYLVLDVFAVDQKLDDGYPATGVVQMSNGTHGLRCTSNRCIGFNFQGTQEGFPDSCYDSSADIPLYNLKPRYLSVLSDAALCMIIMKAQF